MTSNAGEVPSFWIEAGPNRRIPCVASLYMVDRDGVGRLPPAVERAIDRVVDVTGRSGLAMAWVLDVPNGPSSALRQLERVIAVPDLIVLFRCQSVECSERLMNLLHETYTLSLLRAG